ncbi:MAG TPA: hypothetical protein VHD32_03180 [Candidatus Didemnitutus sp.]|nr:hypothetical protein [Candidatus Didemnitutus sp.]
MNALILTPPRPRLIPLSLKLAYTAFLAVMIPVYWLNYGPTNFLYFCDVALLLTLVGIWTESPLLISLPSVGILLPQLLWCVDFLFGLAGGHLTGMTDYMFDPHRSLFLRGLSLFHGWLPLLLLLLVRRVGYDRRAFRGWTLISAALCLVSFFFLPAAGAPLPNPQVPRNINYVFGFDDARPQSWLPPLAYLGVWITLLVGIVFAPTHWLLTKFCPPASRPSSR